jgi:hypothetical protein
LGEGRGGGQHAYRYAISEVVPEMCSPSLDECCGPEAPSWCFRPKAVRSKMQAFYPSVRYFAGIDGGKELLSLHTDAVRALIDEENVAGGGTEREDL